MPNSSFVMDFNRKKNSKALDAVTSKGYGICSVEKKS